eukprot:1039957-Pleurochrysis_carterae.AAC.2
MPYIRYRNAQQANSKKAHRAISANMRARNLERSVPGIDTVCFARERTVYCVGETSNSETHRQP